MGEDDDGSAVRTGSSDTVLLDCWLGLAGVLMSAIWRGFGATSLEANLLCMGATVSYGLGFRYVRRYLAGRREGPLSLCYWPADLRHARADADHPSPDRRSRSGHG